MLDRVSGKIIHIDFGDCFEVAMQRDKYPEKIPFRLTRMLVNAMEGKNGVVLLLVVMVFFLVCFVFVFVGFFFRLLMHVLTLFCVVCSVWH
jgi:phosphatidylinositol kinase/protein kinase (PI-3  family)